MKSRWDANRNVGCGQNRQNHLIGGNKSVDEATRACLAYVAGRAIAGRKTSSIYDYSQGRHITIDGEVSASRVNVYDYERRCYFSGTLKSLFDYGHRAYVSLQIRGKEFSGFDYGSQHHFSGSVSGNSVTLYDYGESGYFSFAL